MPVVIQPKSVFEVIQEECGVEVRDYLLHDLETHVAFGRIEFIHGQSMSVKACCECFGHDPPTSSAPLTTRLKCHCLLHATADVEEKYKRALLWLRDGQRLSTDDHLMARNELRMEYRLKPLQFA